MNCKGYTPMIVAITHCKDCIALRKLVAAGAPYDIVLDSGTFAGMTPLQVAEKFNNERAIAFLSRLLENKDATTTLLIDKETPKNKKLCPICNTLVRYPTQMSRLKDNQAQVEENYKVYGES
jgi:ankyrin repeat protein